MEAYSWATHIANQTPDRFPLTQQINLGGRSLCQWCRKKSAKNRARVLTVINSLPVTTSNPIHVTLFESWAL